METPAGPERGQVDVMMSKGDWTEHNNEQVEKADNDIDDVVVNEEQPQEDEFFFWTPVVNALIYKIVVRI